MQFDNALLEQFKDSLSSYVEGYNVAEEIFEIEDIFGPLCSHCEFAELNIDVVENPVSGWWRHVMNVSLRCGKTCKESLCYQVYFDGESRVKPEPTDRFPGNISVKMACVHFTAKKSAIE
ncbi:hypothetical protein GTA51_01510 [Desulfovibrio aerotolerans]|uniref:Uncharacterized protein n=1 Tax=Solidesulfovibrio aerotolerans TaxID=295255 RepID=A0A7C9NHK4_9BACT|nr:hypothetical protein [Solidesulfovibrio aerotolerans]MYL81816.1 hypothetical protein [Solidesulfovibrio aerotolerans]